MVDQLELRTELQTDPTGLGYGLPNTVNAHQVLNAPRTAIQIPRGEIAASEVIDATDFGELEALTAEKQRLYLALTGPGVVNTASPQVVAAFASIFAGASGNNTRPRLAALQTRNGSRAEELWGVGESVSLREVVGSLL